MRKILTKTGAFLLVVMLMLSMLTPLTTMAKESGKCGDNLTWTLDDSGTLTISGKGDMWNWTTSSSVPWSSNSSSIKSVVINYGVTSIGDWAFSFCDRLTTISIPSGVTSIGGCAFFKCKSLTTISIPESVTSIGNSAFWLCRCLASISIPSGVTSIGGCAFYKCNSLASISIPDSVTSIGNSAFEYCNSLTSISIPSGVTSIGDKAFVYCDNLKEIKILGKNVNIGGDCFKDCPSDLTIHGYGGSAVETYARNNGFAFVDITENKVIGTWSHGDLTATLKSDGTFTISGTGSMSEWLVTSVPWYDSRSSIKTVVIDYGVIDIWIGAFASCTNLTSVSIPETVKTIAKEAFASCTSLEKINIPSGVGIIGQDAFSFCTSLKSVTIPASVTMMGEKSFGYCDSLTDIYYGGNETNWKNLSMDARIPSEATIHYNYASLCTIIGSALRTNITAVINGHAIPSFNVDGYTYIVAEDLKDYGFSVYYDNNTRTLALSRDTSKKYVSRSYVKPYVAPEEVGIKEHDLVATDIVTYIDNNYAQSYNINGQTIIRFDELGRYGAVSYDNSTRIISVNIPGLN